jgi:hypothetical protein
MYWVLEKGQYLDGREIYYYEDGSDFLHQMNLFNKKLPASNHQIVPNIDCTFFYALKFDGKAVRPTVLKNAVYFGPISRHGSMIASILG